MSRLVLAALGVCLLGCGLRTDPEYTPVCVDDNGVAADDTAGTEDGTDTNTEDSGVPLVPRSGSCEDPIDLPAGQTVIVRGSLEMTFGHSFSEGPSGVFYFRWTQGRLRLIGLFRLVDARASSVADLEGFELLGHADLLKGRFAGSGRAC